MVASAHNESLGQRLIDHEEEIVITWLNTTGAEQLLRSKIPIWQAQHDRKSKAQLDQVLRSLRYDSMNTRTNQIVEHHSKTFSWIFDWEDQRPWISFPERVSRSSDNFIGFAEKLGLVKVCWWSSSSIPLKQWNISTNGRQITKYTRTLSGVWETRFKEASQNYSAPWCTKFSTTAAVSWRTSRKHGHTYQKSKILMTDPLTL